MREALRIIRLTNQSQLFAIGTLFLVTHTPKQPFSGQLMSQWLDKHLLNHLMEMTGATWGTDEVEYLMHLGAIKRLQTPHHHPRIHDALQRWNIPTYITVNASPPMPRQYIGLVESLEQYGDHQKQRDPLRPYALTPAGELIGQVIMEGRTSLTYEAL